MEINTAEFAFTAVDEQGFKKSRLPEIALIGRSNVGKSSLINSLCARSKLARVSSTPGKTREVNFYLINDSFYLVDLPGYGYAQVSHSEKARWAEMIEGYFASSPNLKMVFFLLDIRREPSDDDRQTLFWIEHNSLDYALVATKADKVPRHQRAIICRSMSDKLQTTFKSEAICFSTTEKFGRPDLLKAIGAALK
jgi:GTP-binding protein